MIAYRRPVKVSDRPALVNAIVVVASVLYVAIIVGVVAIIVLLNR